MDDKDKKLRFVLAMTKHGLQHFDGGGVISAGNSNPLTGISGALTVQNSFGAEGPNMTDVVNGQNNLAGQLNTEAAGGGPNPAQIQYQQNADQIAKKQAALNSSNRALNPGLAARTSGNEAVTAGQTAAGGAAAQQAEQQLAAQGQLQQLYAQQQNASLGAQGINAQVSQNNTNSVNSTQGGILQGIGSALPIIGGLFAKGGSVHVPGLADFSNADVTSDSSKSKPSGGASSPADPFAGMSDSNFGAPELAMPELGSGAGLGAGASAPSLAASAPLAAAALAKGGAVPMSFAGKWLNSKDMKANGGLMKSGGPVQAANPSQKASVNRDSFKNDKVPALLSEGELVVDKDTLNDPGPIGQMARALAKHIKARNGKSK